MPGQAIQCDCCMYFRFDEFDEAIDEAIEDDIKEADGGVRVYHSLFFISLGQYVN